MRSRVQSTRASNMHVRSSAREWEYNVRTNCVRRFRAVCMYLRCANVCILRREHSRDNIVMVASAITFSLRLCPCARSTRNPSVASQPQVSVCDVSVSQSTWHASRVLLIRHWRFRVRRSGGFANQHRHICGHDSCSRALQCRTHSKLVVVASTRAMHILMSFVSDRNTPT